MALINFARREVEAKIVYYGPAFSGKTTNVQKMHGMVDSGQRGELHTLATAEDRTLFFDYVPLQLGQIAGFASRFKLFTVPGQVFYKETRRIVLQGADAVVFVADSTPDRTDANIDSLVDLEENLRAHGLDLSSIPLVIQLNKRDVPGARAVSDMVTDLNPFGVPVVEAVASEGMGVIDTLKQVTDIAAARIRENLAGAQTPLRLTAIERAAPEDDRKVIREHLDKIRKVRPYEEAKGEVLKAAGGLKAAEVDAFLLANVDRADEILQGPSGPAKPAAAAAAPGAAPVSAKPAAAPRAPAPPPAPAPAGTPSPSLPPAVNGGPALPVSTGPAPGVPRSVSQPGQRSGPMAGGRMVPPPPPPVPGARGGATHEVALGARNATATYPIGAALEATIDPAILQGARLKEANGARVEGGRVVVDVLLERGGATLAHPVTLVPRAPQVVQAPAPPPPPAPTPWSLVGASAILGGAIGTLAGVFVGWLLL